MTRTSLLLAAALGLAAAPSAAVSAAQTGKSTICHRTGQPSQDGLFKGVVLNVSTRALPTISPTTKTWAAGAGVAAKLRQSGGCFTDAKGPSTTAAGSWSSVRRAPWTRFLHLRPRPASASASPRRRPGLISLPTRLG
jgi:hypothetical protein